MTNPYKTKYNSGKDDYEHRVLMEKLLGHKIPREFDVHHIDGNPKNNKLGNLELISHKEHSFIHTKKRWDEDVFGGNRHKHLIEYGGKSLSISDWSKKLGIKLSTLNMRISVYKWSVERALTQKVRAR